MATSPDTNHELPPEDNEKKSIQDPERGEDKSEPDFGPAPDGGRQAWLAAAGAFSVFFCALGYSNSFGVFQEYYLTHQLSDKSPDDIAWIGSVAAFLQFAVGAIGGPLFDRYGVLVIRPSCVILVFTMMMISLCKVYWQFMLAQGVLMGITMGLLTIPAMAPVSQYFDKKRAAALGLVVAGSSCGGIVLPITFSKMLNDSTIGFGWTVRIVGFIMLPFLAFACVAIKPRLPPRTTDFFIPEAFKDAKFLLLSAAMFFMMLGVFIPLFYMPTYAVYRGMDATLASYLLAIINAASIFGRVIPGILADKFGRINMFAFGGISTGVVIYCMNTAKSNAGLIVYSIFIGFISGTVISSGSAAFSLCPKDPRQMGAYMGTGMGLASIAVLIGPPINGALVNHYGGFFEVSIFTGTMVVVGGLIAAATKLVTPEGLFGRV